jgi:hypothetical protein
MSISAPIALLLSVGEQPKREPQLGGWIGDQGSLRRTGAIGSWRKSTVRQVEAAVKLEAHRHQARLTSREARGVTAAARPDP